MASIKEEEWSYRGSQFNEGECLYYGGGQFNGENGHVIEVVTLMKGE